MNPITQRALARNNLFAIARQHTHVYVLIDQFNGNPLTALFEAITGEDAPDCITLTDPIFTDAPDRAPAIFALSSAISHHLELLDITLDVAYQQLKEMAERSVCAWLYSDADQNALVRHMSRRLSARTIDGSGIYLRYFDPRVLPQLVRIFGADARRLFLSQIQTWMQLDRDGTWLRLDNPDSNNVTTLPRLGAQLLASVERISLVNQVAASLAGSGAPYGHSEDASIEKHLISAGNVGLLRHEDQVAFASYAMRHADGFLKNKKMGHWISITKQTALPFAEVVRLETHELQTIESGRSAP